MKFGFDPLYQKYPSRRYPIYAGNGMVNCSSPLAASAGLTVLQKGGIAKALRRMGHDVRVDLNTSSFGRGQIILRTDDGVLVGGTESRTDSNIACY